MKRFNFLSLVVALVLTVAAVGCTTMRETEDGYYETPRSTANRVYVDDPYRGTVVLERDPFTGRYYEVNSYGTGYNNRNYRGYNNGYYGNGYHGRTTNRTYSRGGSYNNSQQNQQPSEEQIRAQQKSREEARKKILGSN
jgi:hypothetical protein